MRLSIVSAILNSHEIVRRQLLHYEKMGLPENVEIVYIDDGSDPPLNFDPRDYKIPSLSFYPTNDTRYWTQPAARNMGVKLARGEYVLCLDIDHIAPKETIDFLLFQTDYDIVRFKREVGILDENGDFTQDMAVLREWGYLGDGLKIRPHGNSYCFNRKLYLELGGVSEQHVGTGKYPNREEVPLKKKIREMGDEISILQDETKPTIYMFPNGHYCGDKDYNPFGFFHNTTRSIRVSRRRQKQAQCQN